TCLRIDEAARAVGVALDQTEAQGRLFEILRKRDAHPELEDADTAAALVRLAAALNINQQEFAKALRPGAVPATEEASV
ncbi:MAG TPA: hypothetical protein VL404_06040, partial [Candidatus Eisenbacteria bacterium]|nr:hypothetical protein [Candidatus Eisenbacteria bacterium]